jgi:hypothetical protein
MTTAFFIYAHFHFSLSPLEQYYLPYYIRTETASLFRPTGMYQLVYITDGKSHSRMAMAGDATRRIRKRRKRRLHKLNSLLRLPASLGYQVEALANSIVTSITCLHLRQRYRPASCPCSLLSPTS